MVFGLWLTYYVLETAGVGVLVQYHAEGSSSYIVGTTGDCELKSSTVTGFFQTGAPIHSSF